MSAAISESAPKEIFRVLQELKIKCRKTVQNKFLPKETKGHADMLLMVPKKSILVMDPDALTCADRKDLQEAGYSLNNTHFCLGKKYPQDCRLNSFPFGEHLIAKRDGTDPAVQSFFDEEKIIYVRQGYVKCSCIPIGENALITDDPSIAKKLQEYRRFEILHIKHSSAVKLTGYEHGFIGGCCGMISSKELAFVGNILHHPEADSIINFCKQHGVSCISLTNGPLTDIGGIIPLTENGI